MGHGQVKWQLNNKHGYLSNKVMPFDGNPYGPWSIKWQLNIQHGYLSSKVMQQSCAIWPFDGNIMGL